MKHTQSIKLINLDNGKPYIFKNSDTQFTKEISDLVKYFELKIKRKTSNKFIVLINEDASVELNISNYVEGLEYWMFIDGKVYR